jgi:hypothetical protein
MLKENLKIVGVVTARDSDGNLLFEKKNTVVEGGRLVTLAKGIGLDAASFAGLETSPDLDLSLMGDPNTLKISKFRCGISDSETEAVESTSTDIDSRESGVYYQGDVEFFVGTEPYIPSDIPAEQNDKQIVNVSSADTIFIRIKCVVATPNGSTVFNTDRTSIDNGWFGSAIGDGIYPINELGLFMTNSTNESSANLWLMFSKLRFPQIPLYSNMVIEFEYRIYG